MNDSLSLPVGRQAKGEAKLIIEHCKLKIVKKWVYWISDSNTVA